MPANLSPVLLVARNNRMRERLEQSLASKGIEVLATSSPTRGLKTLRLAEPQVLLVEYADKGIPGFIDIAKEENPSLRVIVIEDDSPRKPPLRNEVIKALMADGYRRLPSDTEYLISDIERAAEASVAPEEELELPPAFSPTEVVETPESSASTKSTEPVEEFDASSVLPEEVTVNEEEDDVPFNYLEDRITDEEEDEDEGEDEDAGAWAADPYALLASGYPASEYEDDPDSAYGKSPYIAIPDTDFDPTSYGLDDGDDDGDDYSDSMARQFDEPVELGSDEFEEIAPEGMDYSDFARDLTLSSPRRRGPNRFMRPGLRSPSETVVQSRSKQRPREVFFGEDLVPYSDFARDLTLPSERRRGPNRFMRPGLRSPSETVVQSRRDQEPREVFYGGDFDLLIEDPVEYDPYEGERGYMPSPFESEMPFQRPGYQAPTRVIHRDSPPPLRGVPPKLPSFPPPGGYLSEQMAAQRAKRLPPFPPPSYWEELEARRMRPSPFSGPTITRPDLIDDLDNFNVMARRASWMAPARRTAHKATRTAQARAKSKRAPETAFQRKETPTAVFVGGSGKPERPMTLKQAFSCLDLKLQARSGDYIVGCVSCEGDLFKKLGSHQVQHLVRTYVQAQVNAQPGSPFGGMGRVHVTKIDPKKKCAYFRFASHYAGHLPYKTFENDD